MMNTIFTSGYLVTLDLQFFATQANQSVHTGNTVLLMIGNTVVGRAQGVDARRSFGTEGVYEIGDIMPQEHVYNKYEGSVTIERFFVKKGNLKSLGFGALGAEVLNLDVLDIVIVDKATKNVIRAYRGCSIQDYSENFRANAISGENSTWQYLKASDTTN